MYIVLVSDDEKYFCGKDISCFLFKRQGFFLDFIKWISEHDMSLKLLIKITWRVS